MKVWIVKDLNIVYLGAAFTGASASLSIGGVLFAYVAPTSEQNRGQGRLCYTVARAGDAFVFNGSPGSSWHVYVSGYEFDA